MTDDVAITVEGLSKRYFVGHQSAQAHTTLRDAVVGEAGNFIRKSIDLFRGRQIIQGDVIEDFWALKDVSFEIKQGEVVGIIGRNGAGKSTLLKVLSRITEPTKGRVALFGRTSSLLEVGTGFHPELTGRENIFLNGAILGMSRAEIRSKFDEIVSFAEIERFLDTPVKRYSSGMYVRLAFAVAAHLEPEILIIDEVLAVGDSRFQEKCLGKMQDVAKRGRTVLFVSHNMSAVLQLTSRSILLSSGSVEFVGSTQEVVEVYTKGGLGNQSSEYDVRLVKRKYEGTGDAKILSLGFIHPLAHFDFLEPIRYRLRVKTERAIKSLRVSMTVFSQEGMPVGNCFSEDMPGLQQGEEASIAVELRGAGLAPGRYHCAVAIGRGNHRSDIVEYDVVTDTLYFEVKAESTGPGSMAIWNRGWGSIVFPDLRVKPWPSGKLEAGLEAVGVRCD